MKRCLFCLPLLGLAPLLYFLGPYLDGLGILPPGSGVLIAFGSIVIVPIVVSLVVTILPKLHWVIRGAMAICALVAQFVLLFTIDQPAAAYAMMGVAHRLRHEFPPRQLRNCAEQLLQRFHTGKLAVTDRDKMFDYPYPSMADSAKVVADTELPISLRGHFERVFIQKDPNTGDDDVVFVVGKEMGIICDNRKNVYGFREYSIADGVEAYWFQRE